MTAVPAAMAIPGGDFVGEHWRPPAAAPPIAARPFGWPALPLAVLAVIFMPQRAGPRLAVTPWPRTLLVHCGLLVGTALLLLTLVLVQRLMLLDSDSPLLCPYPNATLSEQLRYPAAALVNSLFNASNWSPLPLWLVGGGTLGTHLFLLGQGLLLTPLTRGAAPFGAALSRSLKLSLWSAAVLAAGAGLVAGVTLLSIVLDYTWRGAGGVEEWVVALGFLVLAWWHGTLFALARRLGDEPSASPPRCRGCGYLLTGLPLDGRCAECGFPVRDSNPQFQRATEFANCRPWQGPVAWLQTAARALRGDPFFQTLDVGADRGAATRFLLWSCRIAALLIAVYLAFFLAVPHWKGRLLIFSACLALISVCLSGAAAVVVLRSSRGGFADARGATAAVGYSTAWLPLLALLVVLCTAAYDAAPARDWHTLMLNNFPVRVSPTVLLLCVPPVLLAVWGLLRARAAIRILRHAP